MNQKTEDILTARIEQLESQVKGFEREKDRREYEEEWRWRHIRDLDPKNVDLSLPVPRLEMNYRFEGDYTVIADYGLVYKHFLGQLVFMPFGSTRIGGGRYGDTQRVMELPFREGVHILSDMAQLNLPGYMVCGGSSIRISERNQQLTVMVPREKA